MTIKNFGEYFGCESREILEAEDTAEGYLAGCKYATWIQENIFELYSHKTPAYREAILRALREQL